jgi:hypothetical protein
MGWPIIENCPGTFKKPLGLSRERGISDMETLGGDVMAKLTERGELPGLGLVARAGFAAWVLGDLRLERGMEDVEP